MRRLHAGHGTAEGSVLAWIAERDARDPGTLGGALAVAWALHDVSVAGTIAGRVAAALERLHDPRTAVDGDAIF